MSDVFCFHINQFLEPLVRGDALYTESTADELRPKGVNCRQRKAKITRFGYLKFSQINYKTKKGLKCPFIIANEAIYTAIKSPILFFKGSSELPIR